jgi:hypothetical protein
MIKKIKNILGLTILESIVSTAIVGIGFIAILQMVNFSVQSIDNSGERTKANYLVSMMAEDVIGHRNTTYGVSAKGESDDGTTSEVNKFVDHLASTDFNAGEGLTGPCGGTSVGAAGATNIYETQDVDAPRNKEAKWRAIFDNNRYLKCKGDKDIKKMKVYKICRWETPVGLCPYINNDVYDDGMYIGRIQINLNNGRKRKYLYFQADYKTRK